MTPSATGDTWTRLVASHHAPRLGRVPAHRPDAAILCCSDARVSPNALFAETNLSLFVVRHAGNTVRPGSAASLDYAVGHLGVGLVLVLGHTECGAVSAALHGPDHDPVLEPILAPIRPALTGLDPDGADALEQAVRANVLTTVATLTSDPGPTGRGIRGDTVEVHGAVHDITTGRLHLVEDH